MKFVQINKATGETIYRTECDGFDLNRTDDGVTFFAIFKKDENKVKFINIDLNKEWFMIYEGGNK